MQQRTPRAPLAALILACGCGGAGGDPVSPPPPPPPPPPGAPASLAVQAGDGQQAEPGAQVPIKPVVLVRDAAGRPVPGVTVTFAVDSGGGSLQANSVATGAAGTASPGEWRLGSGEGRNIVMATAGSLAPLKIVAMAAIAPVTIPDQLVGPAGGTVTVNRPGSPIHGMKIVVPAAAYAAGQTFEISYGSSAGYTPPAGATVLSPLITFRVGNGARAALPMLITIPVSVPAGSFPVILLRDPATGRQEPLMTVAHTATSVTGIASHLDGARIPGGSGSFSGAVTPLTAAAASGSAVVVTLPASVLDLDHDSGFRPGVDSWEFRPDNTVYTDFNAAGIVGTEAWYYVNQKASNGNLWNKYQEAAGVEGSNRRGQRWTSLAEETVYDQLFGDMASVIPALQGNPPISPATVLANLSTSSFNALRTALTLTPGVPQMALLFTAAAGEGLAVLVYRSTGQQLFAVDPADPSKTVTLDFSSGQMAPITSAVSSAPLVYLGAVGYSLVAATPDLAAQWPSVANGTVGDAEFPTFRPMVAWGNAFGESAPLTDPVYAYGDANFPVIWVDCLSCHGESRPVPWPHGTAQVAGLDIYAQQGTTGSWSFLGYTKGGKLSLAGPGARGIGFEVQTHLSAGDPDVYWTDWVGFTLRRLQVTITPAVPKDTAKANVDLTIAIPGAPANLEYVWDQGNGTKVITTALTATLTWPLDGTYNVEVTARDKTTKQPVARGTTVVTIEPLRPRWRLTSFAQSGFSHTLMGPPPTAQILSLVERQYGDTEIELLDSLLARPGGATLELFAPGMAPQGIWKAPFDSPVLFSWLLALREGPAVPAMYVTFPRGASLMGGLLATTGPSVIVPPFGLMPPFNPVVFTNLFAQSTTAPVTYVGQAAVKALGNRTAISAHPSLLLKHFEINATTTPTGLAGTITFAASVACVQAEFYRLMPGCPGDGHAGIIRREFTFTAVRQ